MRSNHVYVIAVTVEAFRKSKQRTQNFITHKIKYDPGTYFSFMITKYFFPKGIFVLSLSTCGSGGKTHKTYPVNTIPGQIRKTGVEVWSYIFLDTLWRAELLVE